MDEHYDATVTPPGAGKHQLIEDDAKILAELLMKGCAEYDDDELYSPKARVMHTAGTRAHLKTLHVVRRAMALAADDPRIRFVSKRGRKLFIIGDRVYSFKKLTNNRRPRRSRTRQDNQFCNQLSLLPDLNPDAPNWVAGYVEGGFGETDSLWLVLPGQHGNRAEFEITSFAGVPVEMPADQATDLEERVQSNAELGRDRPRRRRVLPRDEQTGT